VERRLLRSLELLLLGCAPVVLLVLFTTGPSGSTYAWDFHAFWGAATHVAHGHSPYADLGTNSAGKPYPAYLYPPLVAELLTPLGLLPFPVAAALFVAASVCAVVGALWLLDVRDWRCYGAAFLWLPVVHGVRLGALTPLLVLAIAAWWRSRGRATGELFLPLAVTLKLFLWPVLVCCAVRRGRAIGLTLLLTVGGWAVVGFAGFTSYPSLLRATQGQWETNGYGLAALAARVGISHDAANIVLVVAAVGAAALLARLRLDARVELSAAVVVALLVSPVAWLHYSALLLVPVALLRPRFGLAWLAPLALWLTPFEEADGNVWRILLSLAVVVITPCLARGVAAPKPEWRRIVPSE
jgi:hypothetical protein